ncbi:MAG: hypothetical protein JRF56_08730 [Deltaproteobacteria bacterium]|nr:hypothetical protein [Deltaproteobacteria bacterium]
MSKETGSRIIMIVIALAISCFLCNTSAWSAKPVIPGDTKVKPDQGGKPTDANGDGFRSNNDYQFRP